MQILLAISDPAEHAARHAAGFNSNRDAANKAKGELESRYDAKVVTVEGDISQPQSVELLFHAVKVWTLMMPGCHVGRPYIFLQS